MSDELRLPDELAACEARLAAMAPPAPRIDRDELMYQAGWAAALAGASTSSARLGTPMGAASKRSTAMLCAASAALAASLAVAVTLQFRPTAAPAPRINTEVVVSQPREAKAVDASLTSRNRSAPSRPPKIFGSMIDRLVANQGLRSGSTLMPLHGEQLPLLVDGSPAVTVDAAVYVQPTPTKTARQLLEEMLPDSIANPPSTGPLRLWPFGGASMGETI